MNKVILLVGNPGTGKSAILNGLTGAAYFKAGNSFGKGCTHVCQSVLVNGITYMDTPGLDDVEIREQAAEEIRKALDNSGEYRIFFFSSRRKPVA
ncbi:hypothetical protein HK100_002920 [Physocladia obscura]|uniref:G domain-containing protein n=1 Tax=Physocladia obscura TaxID=109957 RepID=A0AAD5SW92_9FUNG|nr:hypothetical protein HK100_002920 [Physocladia obscura]